MRILCCPCRLPFKASRRLPGGDPMKSRVAAASSWVSFRVATLRIDPKRLDLPVSKSSRVSSHLKLLITSYIITHNVTRQSEREYGVQGVASTNLVAPTNTYVLRVSCRIEAKNRGTLKQIIFPQSEEYFDSCPGQTLSISAGLNGTRSIRAINPYVFRFSIVPLARRGAPIGGIVLFLTPGL